jgi:hypothetical protein
MVDQQPIPIDPNLEEETSDAETSEDDHRCSYCKLLRLKDCDVRQVRLPDRCTKCIQRNYPCTSVHPTGELGKKYRLPYENRPPHLDNLCEQRTPWAPISKMRMIEGRCEFRLQVRKRNNLGDERRDFFDWRCLIPFLEDIHKYRIAFPQAGARYPQALKNWLGVWKECQNSAGTRAPPPNWDEARPTAQPPPTLPLNPPPNNRKRGRPKATPQPTPGFICAINNCVRPFETAEELRRHEAGHASDKILEEVTAIRQEFRLERLERMIREQEVSRLLKEILSHLNTNQSVSASTTLVRNPIPANQTTEPPANTASTQCTTNMAPPSNVPESTPGEETRHPWLIQNHKENCVPDELVCRWEPCDVAFDTHGELIQHIREHQLTVQCKWSGCNDIVPITEALRHLTRKHKAHRDGVCRWNNCSQGIADKRQLRSHLTECMNLHPSVFKCPWKDCGKEIKRYAHIKRHLVACHWKLRKWKRPVYPPE